MSKFVLDTTALSYIGDNILSLESEMVSVAGDVSSYDVSEASEFNFGGAISSIASNIEAAGEKIKNTTTLIKNVIDTHTNLQNSLKFASESVVTKTTGDLVGKASVAVGAASAGIAAASRPSTSGGSSSSYSGSAKSTNQNVAPAPTPKPSVTEEKKEEVAPSAPSAPVDLSGGKTIDIPDGLGKVHTYMGWHMITSRSSMQYKLKEAAGMNFDSEGFGKIDGRYVIACTTTFGNVGDYIDFVQEDGSVLKCIIGDIKNQNDRGCNKWGHNNGQTIVEFVVDKSSWYGTNHANPGTSSCHPEWKQDIVSATNYGSYFDKH